MSRSFLNSGTLIVIVTPKIVTLALRNMGLGSRIPGKNPSRIPESKKHRIQESKKNRIPNLGSGSATLFLSIIRTSKAEKNWPEKAATLVADGPDSPGHRLHPGEPFSEALLCVDAAAEGGGGNAAHHSAHKFVLAPGGGLTGREERI
jgi:hypothetical protein